MNCAIHPQTQAVAYCRTCGKALCEDCKRDVMGAIYCEPCIATRLHGQTVPGANVPPPPTGAPRPGLAAFLGLVPGVGAMYNGQFAKAFAHVIIFVLLIIAASHVSGMFGILIGFFVVYMAFEAFKTAEAKRHGLPPPDPLGLDKMLGLQDTQTSVPAPGPAYVAPTPLQVEPPPPPARDNTPIGAIVLIALGVLFLFSNFGLFNLNGERMWPLFLIGIGLWTAYKRPRRQVCSCVRCRTKGMMGPAVLITLGVLFLLQSYYIAPFDRTLPVLLLVIGCILLISRTGSTEGHIERGWVQGAPPPPPPQPWTSGGNPPSSSGPDDTQVRP
jgi:TM2 domain-containing membrane protein YozV